MATLSNYCEAIGLTTEVELGQLKLIARNLREAGQVPQHGRGLHAANLGATHVARLLLGVMVGGIQGPMHRVASAVKRIGVLRKGSGLRIDPFAPGRKPEVYGERDTSFFLLQPDATFLDAFTNILLAFAETEKDTSWHGAVRCLGVKFGAGQAYPWIQFKDDHRQFIGLTNAEPTIRRCAFGSSSLIHRVDTAGMLTQSEIPNGVLLDIAALLGKDRETSNSVTAYISNLKKKHVR